MRPIRPIRSDTMAPKVAAKKNSPQVSSSDSETESFTKHQRACNAVSLKMAKEVKEVMGEYATDLSQDKIQKVCNALMKVIVDQVKSGKNVTLTNHMSFKRVLRKERVHRNPKTGEVITKPAHFVFKMEVKQAMKAQFEELDIKENEVEEEEPVVQVEEEEEEKPVKKPDTKKTTKKGKKPVVEDDE